MIIFWIIIWVLMACVVAAAASSRGLNAVGWWFYGLLIWPLALIHVLVIPKTAAKATQDKLTLARSEGRAPCPFCAEMILPAAKICPHCRSPIEGALTVAAASSPATLAPADSVAVQKSMSWGRFGAVVLGLALLLVILFIYSRVR